MTNSFTTADAQCPHPSEMLELICGHHSHSCCRSFN